MTGVQTCALPIWKNPDLTKMAATTGQGAGLSAVGLSGRFLYFRFFMLKGSFRQYLFFFLVLGAPGGREGRVAYRDPGKYPVREDGTSASTRK